MESCSYLGENAARVCPCFSPESDLITLLLAQWVSACLKQIQIMHLETFNMYCFPAIPNGDTRHVTVVA